MPTRKLTKGAVEKIKAPDPSGKPTLHWDTDLAGFGVLASGTTKSRSYIAQRRLPDGRTRRVTIGAVGEFAKVEDARRKAGEVLLGLRDGRDPKTERRAVAARSRSLRQWLDHYIENNNMLRPRSIEEYRRSIGHHLGDWIDRPLREVTDDIVEAQHARIGRDVGHAAANSVMRALRVVWNHAADRDATLPKNPVRRLKKGWFEVAPRTRLVKADELPAFYRAVGKLPSETGRDYILFVLFTGLRRREAAALPWSEIDFAARVIRLPAVRAKGKRKLDLPMPDVVRDLLIARRALGEDGPWVFAADSKSGHIEEPRFYFDAVAEASGIRVSTHDLRRTFLTIAEQTDMSPMALKALVNHAIGADVTEGYVQMTIKRLSDPMQRVCDKLKELCGIEEPEVPRIGERA